MNAATLIQTGPASNSTEIDEHLFESADVDAGDVVDLVERVSYLEDALEDITVKIRALRPF